MQEFNRKKYDGDVLAQVSDEHLLELGLVKSAGILSLGDRADA